MPFGNYVNALPFHHPLRLAAEAAMLDNPAQGARLRRRQGVRPGSSPSSVSDSRTAWP
jgi:hypothetical protein